MLEISLQGTGAYRNYEFAALPNNEAINTTYYGFYESLSNSCFLN